MAKRRIRNLKLNNQELTPQVIGYLTEKKAGLFYLLVIFCILLAFLYYLPQINKKVEKLWSSLWGTKPEVLLPKSSEQNDLGIEFDFPLQKDIIIQNLTFSDFVIDGSQLIVTIKNNSNEIVNLKRNGYLIYLKDNQGIFRDFLELDDVFVKAQSSQTMKFNIHSSVISKVMIDEFKEEYLVELIPHNNILTCTLGDDVYNFSFEETGLKKIRHIYRNDVVTEAVIYNYKLKRDKLINIPGVTVVLLEGDQLYFEVNLDLDKMSSNQLVDEISFAKDESARIVNYHMVKKGFNCQ